MKKEWGSVQTKQRAERSDKKKRIHRYLDHDTYSHLDKIRQSVNTKKKRFQFTTLPKTSWKPAYKRLKLLAGL